MQTIADRLRKSRKDLKLSQQNLADALGVSKSQVSAWENGHETPSWRVLVLLPATLRVSLDWLILGVGSKSGMVGIRDQTGTYATTHDGPRDYAIQLLLQLKDDDRQLIVDLMSRLPHRTA